MAAICSAAPKSCAFRGTHSLKFLGRSKSALRQKNSRPQPGILFERTFRRGSLALAKEARDRQSVSPPYPFNLAIAALAAICSAAPKSCAFRGTHSLKFLGRSKSALRQKNSRPQPGILFERTFRRGSLALAKEARDRQSVSPPYPFNLAIAALAAICSASFLLWPLPRPATSPFRSTSTKKRLSWSGPSSPVKRYFSTWPLSRWTNS